LTLARASKPDFNMAGEKAKVNHQLNRQSRQIYRDKHNGAKQ
jgi:hypothetical protein